MTQYLVDIALPIPVDHPFTYIVPPDLQQYAIPGARAVVPFGRKTLTGVIVGTLAKPPARGLKPVRDILDSVPSYSADMLKLTKWIAEYYFAPWGETLKAAAPQSFLSAGKRSARLIISDPEHVLSTTKQSAPKQHAVLLALQRSKTASISSLQTLTKTKSIHTILNDMAQKGWIELFDDTASTAAKPKLEKTLGLTEDGRVWRNDGTKKLSAKQTAILAALQENKERSVPVQQLLKQAKASLTTVKTLARRGLVQFGEQEVFRTSEYEHIDAPHDITLNSSQQSVLTEISNALDANAYATFLLHGVTGSGKTQVYIEAIRRARSAGKAAIVLVPEISLTPQIVRRFKSYFGDDVAVMHSRMSAGERYDVWRLARSGKVHIVIGARSAIFAPLSDIGLIVVDEEHEASYKQFDAMPRYHARDVAVVRALHAGAVVLLGSATPSAESYYNAISGKYRLLEMPERVDSAQMPRIDIVDMTTERKRVFEAIKKDVQEKKSEFPKRLPDSSISNMLRWEIAERMKKREGVILLQNRRGFSHVVECFDCGHVEKCDNCDVTLTYHATKKHLRCHYCGFVKKPPSVCPDCKGFEIRFHAFGTQQVHEELQKLFPDSKILRMDLDTTTRKGAHDKILMQFGNGEADILLGTQMVAKGLDFPRVTLVGVISADTQMLLPDFRSSERTFQLLTQVAGRSGRAKLAGEVIIQTMQPNHYSLKHVVAHDFPGFYKEELAYRQELDYPPFSRIVLVEFKGARENDAHHHAKKFAEYLAQQHIEHHSILLGPAEAAIPRVRNKFRKHIIIKNLKIKDPSGSLLRAALLNAKREYDSSTLGKNRNVQMTMDVDPAGMM